MDEWENFNETSLLQKVEFYSNLNMKSITDEDYLHAKIVNTGEYLDFYLKSNTLLLANVFENVRKMRLRIYHLDPVKYFSTPGLGWQAALKKAKVKSELLTDIDMLLMVEKGIRRGIFHANYWYAKANSKYM